MPQQPIAFSTYPHSVPLFAGGVRLVNYYPEKAEGPARSEFTLIGSPGMKLFADASSIASGLENRGFREFNGTQYAVIGSYLVSYSSAGSVTSISSSVSGSGPVSFVSDGDQMVIITNGDDYLFDGADLSQFTGANIVDWRDGDILDGRGIYVQQNPSIPGRWSYTDVNQLQTVGASSFANAESEPDALLRVKVIDRRINFFGENTIEPWYATGDSTTPFARFADGIESYGLAATGSLAKHGGLAFFLAKSRSAQPHMRMKTGFGRSERISTNALDAIIDSGTYSDAVGFAYEQRGHIFYCLVFPTLGRCFVYDATLSAWHERQSGVSEVAGWDARHCIVAHDKVIVGHKSDGKIYELDFDTHTDASVKRLAMFTAQMQSSGEFWNCLDTIVLDMSVGVGASGATVEPRIIMQLSKDGGQTWGDERARGFGLSGDRDRQVKWSGCGRFRHCLARFKITDSVLREVVKVHARGRPGRPV